MKYILQNWIKLIFLLSIIALISALVAEYLFNLTPCKMCLKQRHPYYFIISLITLSYFINYPKNIILILLIKIAIIYGLFYSIWHVGIEQKIFTGPKSCSGVLSQTNSIDNLKEQITNQTVVNCSEIIWSFGGISAAAINSLLLLLFLIINSMFLIKKLHENKKKE